MTENTYHCDICKVDLDITSKSKHLRSFKHILVESTLKEQQNKVIKENFTPEVISTPVIEIPENRVVKQDSIVNLDDLRNDKFTFKASDVPLPTQPKVKKQKPKKIIDDDESIMSDKEDLFDNKGTHLFGKENLELLHKIKQYKTMFPKELSKFRIKKNANETELKNYLEEIEILVNLSGCDIFITEAILATLQGVEIFTQRTSFNITGLSIMLKSNPQFHHLSKQLYLKYNSFGSVPIEYQMLMLIFTTSYVAINKNKNIGILEKELNEPYKG